MRLPVRYLMVPVAPPRSLVAAGAKRASARSCAFAAGEGLFPKTLRCSLSVEEIGKRAARRVSSKCSSWKVRVASQVPCVALLCILILRLELSGIASL